MALISRIISWSLFVDSLILSHVIACIERSAEVVEHINSSSTDDWGVGSVWRSVGRIERQMSVAKEDFVVSAEAMSSGRWSNSGCLWGSAKVHRLLCVLLLRCRHLEPVAKRFFFEVSESGVGDVIQ